MLWGYFISEVLMKFSMHIICNVVIYKQLEYKTSNLGNTWLTWEAWATVAGDLASTFLAIANVTLRTGPTLISITNLTTLNATETRVGITHAIS